MAAFVAGVVLAIAPATLRNLAVSGEPVLISSHGGLNLYVGNGPTADGTYSPIPGITPSIDGQARDAKKVAEAAEGRPLSTREVSAHFTRLAVSWAREHPGAALRLFLKKLGLLANRIEVPLNLSYAWYAASLSPLSFLVVGPWLLVPLGVLGLVWRLFEAPRRAFAVWAAFAPAYAVSVALFFVSSRYRLPLLLPLAVGAGFALDALASRRPRPGRKAPRPRRGGARAARVPRVPADGDRRRTGERGDGVHPLADFGGSGRGGERAPRAAREVAPASRRPLVPLGAGLSGDASPRGGQRPPSGRRSTSTGTSPRRSSRSPQACVGAGDLPGALTALRAVPAGAAGGEAGAIPEAEGLALLDGGREADALPFLLEACRISPGRASAHQNAATLLGRAGRLSEARAHAAEALRLNPSYEKARALLEALGGKPPAK